MQAMMQGVDFNARGLLTKTGDERVEQSGEGSPKQSHAESKCKQQVLEVGFVDGGRMVQEQF